MQTVGSAFTVQIKVAGMDPFNGWDIEIQFDPSVINATSPGSLSIAGNTFQYNYTTNRAIEAVHCVNNVGTGCGLNDGLGIVHSTVVYFSNPPQLAQGDGMLLSITFKVVGSGSYDLIHILNPVITNPNPVLIDPSKDGVYGIPPGQGFKLTAIPSSAKIQLGSSANITLAVSSFGGYSGTVNLTTAASQSGLLLSLNATSVSLSLSPPPSFVNLNVAADPNGSQTSITIIVTGTSSGLSESATVSIDTLNAPDFSIGVSPSLLKIHATSSGSSIITLIADPGFIGSIHLRMDVPPIPGLIASLGATDFTISHDNPGTTVFAVRTPPSDFPFKYQINITASSQSSTHIAPTIVVQSPSPSFDFQIGSSGFVVQAGQSRTFTLNATSVDYFKGKLFLLASSLSGIKETFTRPSVELEFGNSSTSLMTITTDAYLSLGNHDINVTALGTTFLGVPVNHSIIVTVTIIPVPVAKTILGLQPLAYFGIVGVLWLGIIGAAIREVRKPKPKRFLS